MALALLLSAARDAHARRPPVRQGSARAVTADDSTQSAWALVTRARPSYGQPDTWRTMKGVRYYITYRIPGPDGSAVQEWTESHTLWLKDPVRGRIDNATDSTVIVIRGDTTLVRRGGAWTTEKAVLDAARTPVLDAIWLLSLPHNLFETGLKLRVDKPPTNADPGFTVRAEYGAGQSRPPGSIARVAFDTPALVVRSVHWYDPRSKGWFLLEQSNEKSRYNWTWSENRTLYASDTEGTKGPVIWTGVVQDMQIESQMPDQVLTPPLRAGPGTSGAPGTGTTAMPAPAEAYDTLKVQDRSR